VAEDKAVLIKTAYSYYQKGDWDRAIEEYHKLADLDPKDLNVHNMLADIYGKKGDVQEALQQYDVVAQGFDEKNQIDKVLQVYRRMLKLVPGDAELSAAVQGLLEKYLARARDMEETDPAKSADILRSILRAEPNRTEAAFQLARLLMKMGQKLEAIEGLMNLASSLDPETQTGRLSEVLQMVAEIDPVNVEARETLTQLLVRAGQTSLALKNLQSLIEIYISHNDYSKAEQSAQQALALGDVNTYYHLGVIYFNQQKYTESRQSFERFLQLQGGHVGALKYLALDFLRMNQNQEAVKVYQKILDVYFNENLLDEAKEVRQTILELDPNNQIVGQYALDQALVPPTEAEASAPEVSTVSEEAEQQAFLVEAQVYADKGLYEQSIDVYLDMLKRWPQMAEIRVKLQQVYALMARSAEPAEKTFTPEEIKAELETQLREQMRQELEEQARNSRQMQDELERRRELDQLRLKQELEAKLMEQVQKTREEELRVKLMKEFEEKQNSFQHEKEKLEKESQQFLEKMRHEMENSRLEMEKKIREQLETEFRQRMEKEAKDREALDAKEREKRQAEASVREAQEKERRRLEEQAREALERERRHVEALAQEAKEREKRQTEMLSQEIQGMEKRRIEEQAREALERERRQAEALALEVKEREKRQAEALARERDEMVKAQLKLQEEQRYKLELEKREQEAAKARINQEIYQGMERIRVEKEKETKSSATAPASPSKGSGSSESLDDPFIRKTLADIYAAQGLYLEALKIYERILSEEPDNHEVKEKLRDILRMKGI
jgi:tetratricopeptide (TPR) repeat protein